MKYYPGRIQMATLAIGLYLLLVCACKDRSRLGIASVRLGASAASGYIPADFTVSDFGSATYSIQIEAPQGTAGVQPSLSLVYASGAPNGILGQGWTLSGLTYITRTGRTIPDDGIKGGVGLNQGDRFLINGQRLIAYRDSAGNQLLTQQQRNAAYGRNGTEYHTQLESFMRVFSFGNLGNGPAYFVAYSKDGSKMEFGTSAGSALMPVGSPAALAWAANKVTDRNGNFVTVQYAQDSVAGTFFPGNISYTGNDRAGLVPQRMIEIIAEPRPDTLFNTLVGTSFLCTQRIKEIRTYVDLDGNGNAVNDQKNLVNVYSLSYEVSPVSGRSRITSLAFLDSKGNALPPTNFSWTGAASDSTIVAKVQPLSARFRNWMSTNAVKVKGDFDGDGRIDISFLKRYADTAPVALSRDSGFQTTVFPVPASCRPYLEGSDVQQLVADINGDGLSDIALFKTSLSFVPVLYANGQGAFAGDTIGLPSTWSTVINAVGMRRVSGDFNGDGLADIVGFNANLKSLPMILSVAGQPYSYTNQKLDTAIANVLNTPGAVQQLADFNGDGLTDISCFVRNLSAIPIMFADGNGGFNVTKFRLPIDFTKLIGASNTTQLIGDFNGDMLQDMAFVVPSINYIPMLISRGDGSFNIVNTPLNTAVAPILTGAGVQLFTGDVNGDLILDIAAFRNADGAMAAVYSHAGGAFTNAVLHIDTAVSRLFKGSNISRFIGDFNGDGITDISALSVSYSSMPVLYGRNINTRNNLPDMITAVQNGIGGTISISYNQFSNLTTTNSFLQLPYPLLGAAVPQFVVAAVVQQDNASNPSSAIRTSYQYDSSITDNFYGWRGFARTIVITEQNRTRTVNNHLVQFPYSGQTYKSMNTDMTDTTICMGITYNLFSSAQNNTSDVYSVWQTAQWDCHYTLGNYNYTRGKQITYDSTHANIVTVRNVGDIADASDDYYIYFTYGGYPADTSQYWKGFYPLTEKGSINGDTSSVWNEGIDLFWNRYAYDSRMNIVQNYSFSNSNGGGVMNKWGGTSQVYDVFGNVRIKKSPPNLTADSIVTYTRYDSIYHTFPWITTSARPNPLGADSVALVTTTLYEPMFGQLILLTDANGHNTYSVPDGGIDGFGRLLIEQQLMPTENTPATAAVYRYTQSKNSGYVVTASKPVNWTTDVLPDTGWQTNHTYYDGLARTSATARNGSSADSVIASWTQYQLAGQVWKQYLPVSIAAGGSLDSIAPVYPSDSAYYRSVYDTHGLLSQVFSPDANKDGNFFLATQTIYDQKDNRIQYVRQPWPGVDSISVRWKIYYGSNGKVISRSGPYDDKGAPAANFGTDSFLYDRLGRLIRVIDPLGQQRLLSYNSLSQKISEYTRETDTVQYAFSQNGWIISKNDTKGTIAWRYDDLGRVIRKTSQANGANAADSIVYVYDNTAVSQNTKGRLSQVILHSANYTYNYDNNGNISNRVMRFTELPSAYTESRTYDALARVVQMVYPNQDIVNYTYDHAGNLRQAILNGEVVSAGTKFTVLGEAGITTYQNGVESVNQFNRLGQLSNTYTNKLAYQLASYQYNWSRSGKLVSVQDLRTNIEDSMRLSQAFTYYPSGRLWNANGAYGKMVYGYDAAGNVQSDGSRTYRYDAYKKHELTGISMNGSALFALSYDSAGNLNRKTDMSDKTASSSLLYEFSAGNALVSVTQQLQDSSAVISSFEYDEDGHRIIKRDKSQGTTYYISPYFEVAAVKPGDTIQTMYVGSRGRVVYSKTQSIAVNGKRVMPDAKKAETAIFGVIKGGGIASALMLGLIAVILLAMLQTAKKLWAWWRGRKKSLRGIPGTWRTATVASVLMILMAEPALANLRPGANGAGVPVAGQVRYYQHSLVGSTTLVTDETGGLATSLSYRPFGSIDDAHSTGENDFRAKFTGKELDASTRLDYFGSRYYDSDIGRFISVDPAQQYHSPYLYGDDDPLSGVDPDGNFFFLLVPMISAMDVLLVASAYIGASEANHSFNPFNWNLSSSKTWMGMLDGVVAAATVVVSVAAIVLTFGEATPEVIAMNMAVSMAMAGLDAYTFGRDRSVMNGIAIGLDLIPFVGPLLGRGADAVKVADKAAEDISKASRGAEEGADISKSGDELELGTCPLSFAAGTMIQMEDGEKPIENVGVGEKVAGFDAVSNKTGSYAVSRIFKRVALGFMLIVTSSNDSLAVTPEHPFFLADKTQTTAAELKTGDALLTHDRINNASATTVSVRSVKWYTDSSLTVYNFEVDRVHNYFVSHTGVLVHNPKDCGKSGVGGKHGDTKKFSEKKKFESNHFPPSSAYKNTPYEYLKRDHMPAVTMEYDVHRAVSSTGSSAKAVSYRLIQNGLMKQGKFAEAQKMDIEDMFTFQKKLSTNGIDDLRYGIEDALKYSYDKNLLKKGDYKALYKFTHDYN